MSPLPEQPVLRGARVLLRAARPDDVPALFAMHSDAGLMRYWSTPPFTDIEQAHALFERNDRGVRAGDFAYWLIEHEGRAIGSCTLFAVNTGQGRAEIGYALASDCWGHGYAQEALRLVLDYAFFTLGLRRIEADTDPRNAPSLRLLEKLGFAREGLLRERWLVGDELCDSVLLGLLARDYATAATSSGTRLDGATEVT